MSRLVQVAWLLPALWFLLWAARVAIADLRDGPDGRSWCLDCADAVEGCDCLTAVEVHR